MTLETCLDCNSYDDVSQDDTFMYSFGDYWLCGICAEARGIDP